MVITTHVNKQANSCSVCLWWYRQLLCRVYFRPPSSSPIEFNDQISCNHGARRLFVVKETIELRYFCRHFHTSRRETQWHSGVRLHSKLKSTSCLHSSLHWCALRKEENKGIPADNTEAILTHIFRCTPQANIISVIVRYLFLCWDIIHRCPTLWRMNELFSVLRTSMICKVGLNVKRIWNRCNIETALYQLFSYQLFCHVPLARKNPFSDPKWLINGRWV